MSAKQKNGYAPRRGWPVVATGTPAIPAMDDYLRWRARLALPEESTDFSDRDVFDVIEFLLEQDRTRPRSMPVVCKAVDAPTLPTSRDAAPMSLPPSGQAASGLSHPAAASGAGPHLPACPRRSPPLPEAQCA